MLQSHPCTTVIALRPRCHRPVSQNVNSIKPDPFWAIRVVSFSGEEDKREEFTPDPVYLDESVYKTNIKSPAGAVFGMQREAAALDVLAQTYRATL